LMPGDADDGAGDEPHNKPDEDFLHFPLRPMGNRG
jgi:hypothetical protein